MKKLLSISLCFLLLFCCSCSKNKSEYTDDEATTVTVYVTRTGTKYHRKSCQYLSKSKIEITLQEAIDSDYGRCSKCNPPKITK